MTDLISVSGLSKQYQGTVVVDHIDLTVKAGQVLGLIGPNGAGKTTCLKAMLGLIDCEGHVDVLGFNPRTQRQKMLQQVAYVADVAILPKWLKVSQALDYMTQVHSNFSRQQAEAFLAKTNIPHKAKVKTLSKGMVAQLHLALILAIDAKVLILDEPTLGLDLLTRREFYNHLLEDFYDDDKCIVITTHQIEGIEHILTDVAFLQEGNVALADSVEAVRERFKMVTVGNEELEQARALEPLHANTMMGLTTMLFDSQKSGDTEQLSQLGKTTVPSLADIFVAVMNKEAY